MNSAGYGGSAAQRGYEAPACVQNAMVTKDKKPFTYTPGGIDLSQIKSERMAKRLARNAQAEGATGASQLNRPTQPQSPGSGNAASQIGAAGMGMPFQVLPPPPPPASSAAAGSKKPATTTQKPELNYNSNNSTQSQQQQQQYTPTQSTYSPSYQTLQQQQQQQQQQSPYNNNITPPLSASTPPQQQQQQQQSPRPEFRSVAPPQSPAANVYTRQTDSPRADTSSPPQRATESPFRYGGQQQQPQQRAAPAVSPLAQQPQTQSPKSFTSSPTAAPATAGAQSTLANNSPNSQPSAQTVPWRTQRTPTQQQQQQQQPQSTAIYNNVSPQQQQQLTQQAPAYQGPKPTNVGSLYIAPLAPPTEPQAPSVVRQFQQQQQQQRESPIRQIPQQQTPQQQQSQPLRSTVPWLSSKPKANEQPEWARPEENGNVVPSSLHRMKSPPPPAMVAQQSQQQQQPTQQPLYYQQQQQQQQNPQSQHYGYQPEQGNGFAATTPANFGSHGVGSTGLRLQINANANSAPTQQSGPRERIIPIQLEGTPTNAPQQPNFNVSYGGVTTAPSSYVVRSPNQFVDQGYNNYPPSAGTQQQRVMSPTQQLNAPRIVQQQQQYANNNVGAGGNRSRIIPITMEGGSEGTRGPISPSPIVLQNDPRSSPIQSKSFRILQKITDTIDDGSGNDKKVENNTDAEPQLQRPQYARQMSAQQARQQPNVEQMRRMHITQDPQQQQQQQQQPQSPQAWNQDMPQPYVHPSEQQVPEPKKYTGSAIPSRSFKILQAMTTPENAGPGQSDL